MTAILCIIKCCECESGWKAQHSLQTVIESVVQWLNDRQPYAFDKFDESNEHSHSKLSDVDHEVPNEPEQALYPTYNAWLKLNAHLKLYNFSYLSILTVERFFNLNSKSFW